jgi:hypothetical protein
MATKASSNILGELEGLPFHPRHCIASLNRTPVDLALVQTVL